MLSFPIDVVSNSFLLEPIDMTGELPSLEWSGVASQEPMVMQIELSFPISLIWF